MAKKTKKARPVDDLTVDPRKYIEFNPEYNDGTQTAVLNMGDFSPPTKSDKRLVEMMVRYSSTVKANPIVFVSSGTISEGLFDNQHRIQMSKEVFGNIVYPTTVSSIQEAMDICHSKYSKVIIVCHESVADDYMIEGVDVVTFNDGTNPDSLSESVINNDFPTFKRELANPLYEQASTLFSIMFTQLTDNDNLNEMIRPMSYAERLKKAQTMRRYAKRIEIARERAADRRATPEKILLRARKRALEIIRAKILHNKQYADLSSVEKNAIDTRLMAIPPTVIERIAKRLVPSVRKSEAERYSKRHKGHYVSLSSSSTGHKTVNEQFEDFVEDIQNILNLSDIFEDIDTHYQRARESIRLEKQSDAKRHKRMIISAKRADLNRLASDASKETKYVSEENDAIDQIIKQETKRKKLMAALKDYEKTSDSTDSSDDDRQRARDALSNVGMDPDKADRVLQLYRKFALSRAHNRNFGLFDVVESDDVENSTPDQREWGTDSLTYIYKKETPGQ